MDLSKMDYALRQGGWLDELRNRSDTWAYIAESNKQTVGFSLLSVTAKAKPNSVSPYILTGRAEGSAERSRLQS